MRSMWHDDTDGTSLQRVLHSARPDHPSAAQVVAHWLAEHASRLDVEGMLRTEPLATVADVLRASPPASLEVLRHLKQSVKDELERDASASPVVAYMLVVAAAAAWHRASLTTLPAAQLIPIQLDLAAALPAPFDDLCANAAIVLGAEPPSHPAPRAATEPLHGHGKRLDASPRPIPGRASEGEARSGETGSESR